MKKIIDLRSDTVTRPSKPMLEAMMNARVGDDVFGDDPTVIALEEKTASLFGKEKAIFCPSGTMANQIAIKVHTRPGDEVICDEGGHVYHYEGGGIAFNSGCSVRLIPGDRGRLKAHQIIENINPDDIHQPRTSLVVIENTNNRGGGSVYNFTDILEISVQSRKRGMKLHLDGARLFNAIVESGDQTLSYGETFDSISICLSKGLGAPVGSLLIGNSDFIKEARRVRKLFGGGMRQSGFLAAAGIYALDNNISRLKEDHRRARLLGNVIKNLPFVENVLEAQTNILIFNVKDEVNPKEILEKLKDKGLLAIGFGHQSIRFVTHLDFTEEDLDEAIRILKEI